MKIIVKMIMMSRTCYKSNCENDNDNDCDRENDNDEQDMLQTQL